MNNALERTKAELRDLQDKIEGMTDDEELREINQRCGELRREIRRAHQRASNINAALRPRFTERGRTR